MLRFPPEIIDTIASCNTISTQDLSSLSRVNSKFLQISRRLLYRSTSIRLSPGPDASLPAFLANSDIGVLVTSFSFSCPLESAACPYVYTQLARALQGMPNCMSVDLQIHKTASWTLQNVRWPNLRAFRSSFPFDNHVATLLTRTPHLQLLEIPAQVSYRGFDGRLLGKGSCPRLSHFMGPPQVAELLAPGRPVEQLHLSGYPLTADILDKLAMSTRPILVLDATIDPCDLLQILSHLSRCMPHLNCLRLGCPSPVPNMLPQDGVANLLRSMADLHSVELCGFRLTFSTTQHRWLMPTFNAAPYHLLEDYGEDEWTSWSV